MLADRVRMGRYKKQNLKLVNASKGSILTATSRYTDAYHEYNLIDADIDNVSSRWISSTESNRKITMNTIMPITLDAITVYLDPSVIPPEMLIYASISGVNQLIYENRNLTSSIIVIDNLGGIKTSELHFQFNNIPGYVPHSGMARVQEIEVAGWRESDLLRIDEYNSINVSSVHQNNNKEYLLDNNVHSQDSRWLSTSTDNNPTIHLTLNEIKKVQGLSIFTGNSFPNTNYILPNIRFRALVDGVMTEIWNVTNNTLHGIGVELSNPINTDYIEVTFPGSSGIIRVYEVGVFAV